MARLAGARLTPWRAFYLATLGGAQALGLEGSIGGFRPGREADFVVLDPEATPLLARRMARARLSGRRFGPSHTGKRLAPVRSSRSFGCYAAAGA